MAIDKAVDSTQLNADITTVANAIRTKGGTSEQLSFPSGMAQAVADLPSGGTTITDGIVVKARDANGYPTEIDLYMPQIYKCQFYNRNSQYGIWLNLATIDFKIKPTSVGNYAFEWCYKLEHFDFSEVLTINGYAFDACTSLKEVNAPKITTLLTSDLCFNGCTGITNVYLPKCVAFRTAVNNGNFVGCTGLQTVQLGSVGYGVTTIGYPFKNCTQAGLTITVYCKGSYADTAITQIRSNATNATIIIKASEDTTYNEVSYSAGDTMITATVEV